MKRSSFFKSLYKKINADVVDEYNTIGYSDRLVENEVSKFVHKGEIINAQT